MNLAMHSSRSNTVGFWFSSRASSGPFGWIFDWKVREESWIFWPLCCEVWKRRDAILGGKIAPALEPFQNKDSSLVLLLYGTVNGELKFIQNRSKNRFWGKRTTIHHRQGNPTFIYHWFIYIVSDIIPANFFWDISVRFLSWECWDFLRRHDHFRRFPKKSEVFRRSPKSSEDVRSLPKAKLSRKRLSTKSEIVRKVLSFIHFTHGFRSLHGSELTYFWKLCQARRQQLTFFNPQAWDSRLRRES